MMMPHEEWTPKWAGSRGRGTSWEMQPWWGVLEDGRFLRKTSVSHREMGQSDRG